VKGRSIGRESSRPLRLPLGPSGTRGSARAAAAIATALVLFAMAAAVGPWAKWARASVATTLVLLAGAAHHALGRKRQPPRGWVVVDDAGVHRVIRGRSATLVDLGEPFGVTIFASADRAKLLLALTTSRATRYLPARVRDTHDAQAAPTVIERAATAGEGDLRGADDSSLSAADAERLITEVARRAPSALDRVYLSDATGEPVVLDRQELRVGSRRIDLSAPLEWRASLFQELGARAASVCQATWVRQADVELVLVAPMEDGGGPRVAGVPPEPAFALSAKAQRAVARDVRLMQAPVGEPPPRELRRAIDRVFMLPLRRALDRAPRVARGLVESRVSSRPC
jgi:hypothetical protein